MNSNEIAWGIVKAVLILAGIYYGGIFLLGLIGVSAFFVLSYIGDNWKLFLFVFVGTIAWNFFKPEIEEFFQVNVEPRLNQGNSIWRWLSIFVSICCFTMLIIFGWVIKDMTRPTTSTDVGFMIFLILGAPVFLYLALRKSKVTVRDIPAPEYKDPSVDPLPVTTKADTPFRPDSKGWKQVEQTSHLYCYQCTKKLGIQSWDNSGKGYCDACHKKLSA